MARKYLQITKVFDQEFERLIAFEGAIGYVDLEEGQTIANHKVFHITTKTVNSIAFYETFPLDSVQYTEVDKMSDEKAFNMNSDCLKKFQEHLDEIDYQSSL